MLLELMYSCCWVPPLQIFGIISGGGGGNNSGPRKGTSVKWRGRLVDCCQMGETPAPMGEKKNPFISISVTIGQLMFSFQWQSSKLQSCTKLVGTHALLILITFIIKMYVYKMTCMIHLLSMRLPPPSPTKQCWYTHASYSFPVYYF